MAGKRDPSPWLQELVNLTETGQRFELEDLVQRVAKAVPPFTGKRYAEKMRVRALKKRNIEETKPRTRPHKGGAGDDVLGGQISLAREAIRNLLRPEVARLTKETVDGKTYVFKTPKPASRISMPELSKEIGRQVSAIFAWQKDQETLQKVRSYMPRGVEPYVMVGDRVWIDREAIPGWREFAKTRRSYHPFRTNHAERVLVKVFGIDESLAPEKFIELRYELSAAGIYLRQDTSLITSDVAPSVDQQDNEQEEADGSTEEC